MQPRIVIVGHVVNTPQAIQSQNGGQYTIVKVRSDWSYFTNDGQKMEMSGFYDILFGQKKYQEAMRFNQGEPVVVEASLNSKKNTTDNGREFYNLSLNGISIEKFFLKPLSQNFQNNNITENAMNYAKKEFQTPMASNFTSEDIPF